MSLSNFFSYFTEPTICKFCNCTAHKNSFCPVHINHIKAQVAENEIVAAEKMKMKMSLYTEEEKCRIAEWMRDNTPHGRLIDLEWQPYLMKQIEGKKKKHLNSSISSPKTIMVKGVPSITSYKKRK